jgi:hypothetical protein
MISLVDRIQKLAFAPDDPDAFRQWVDQDDALEFLRGNIDDEELVIYANVPYTFVHGVLIPNKTIAETEFDDLLSWNYSPYPSWGVCCSAKTVSLEPPLASSGNRLLAQGQQIVFIRSFDGVPERRHYIEILQPLVHTAGLHDMPERDAWCQLDRHGDLEDKIRVLTIPPPGAEPWGGTVVLIDRDILETYAALTDSQLLRMFDFTRFRSGSFGGWGAHREERKTAAGNLHYRHGALDGQASFVRGVQIVPLASQKEDLSKRIWPDMSNPRKEYASFIAHDWKNNRVVEISCAPEALANYFTKSDLPFEITPAFFRPEVLLKYKSNRQKYLLQERSVSCRGTWHLKTFDINEAGQVHTYLVYLSHLPYEEQLHWKQYNEPPKAPISKRAFDTDMRGEFHLGYNPLQSLKGKLSELHRRRVSWWKLRTEGLLEQSNYPVTAAPDEWSEEILTLDQLLVEGFEERWLRKQAVELGRAPALQSRSLKLIEECLIGLSFEEEHARQITAPVHELHNLRSKLKGHASGDTARSIKSSALAAHGTFRKHFADLVTRCDEAMGTIAKAFDVERMQDHTIGALRAKPMPMS